MAVQTQEQVVIASRGSTRGRCVLEETAAAVMRSIPRLSSSVEKRPLTLERQVFFDVVFTRAVGVLGGDGGAEVDASGPIVNSTCFVAFSFFILSVRTMSRSVDCIP